MSLKKIFLEAAYGPESASDYCLMAKISPMGFTFVLYDGSKLKEAIQDFASAPARKQVNAVRATLIGSMSLKKATEDIWTVVHVKAKNGWGPMMYDYAMNRLGPIMSDRENVSLEARDVWYFYLNKRNDVAATPIRDHDLMFNSDPKDPLNFFYSAKSPSTASFAKLEENHRATIQSLSGGSAELKKKFEGFLKEAAYLDFSEVSL